MNAQPEFRKRFQKKIRDPRIIVIRVLVALGMALSACSLPVAPATTAPPVSSESVQPAAPSVTMQTVTIKTGIDLSVASQAPRYLLETGQGHYLLYVFETKKLTYDGNEVYSGEYIGMALSHNGLHYAYIAGSNQPDFEDLYVDGVKVATAKYLSNPAVTNNGGHYFYTACKSEKGMTGTCLFKDGKDIFQHPDGIMDFWIGGDGSTYFASLRNFDGNGNSVESLVKDGEEIYKGGELKDKAFSADGNHYAYIAVDANTHEQSLVVNGNEKRSSTALNSPQVTDAGSYCVWDAAQKKAYVNEKEIPLNQESGIGC